MATTTQRYRDSGAGHGDDLPPRFAATRAQPMSRCATRHHIVLYGNEP